MPVVASLLLATLVLGFIARTVPQLNVLMLGFGLNSLVAMGVLSLTIGAAAWALQDYVEPALELIQEALLS
jgi:flagellar biosynthetic protein FliR